jgi:pSer/pThr/pTyr-binding forkhead associated (FHA) protein
VDTTITLRVVDGPLAGCEYVVRRPDRCVIGRAADCDLTLPDTWPDRTASRHHCRVEWTPAGPVVRDLGSRNGTYLNGTGVGRRPPGCGPADGLAEGPGVPLADGDELRVGATVFRAAVVASELAGALAGAAAD